MLPVCTSLVMEILPHGHTRWTLAMARVKGAMGALIAHMVELGWTMVDVNSWKGLPDEQGNSTTWEYIKGSDPTALIEEVQEQIVDRIWQQAAEHRNSQGMWEDGYGPDITGLRKHYHYLYWNGRHTDAGILMAIGTGELEPCGQMPGLQ